MTVNPIPSVAIILPGPQPYCGSAVLTATGGPDYLWSTGATTSHITVMASGSYTTTVTNTYGCTASASVSVTVNPLPPAVITPNGTTEFCEGGSVVLSASVGSGYTYLWSNGATTQDITAISSGSYVVTVTDANSCDNVSPPEVVTVNPYPTRVDVKPDSATICSDSILRLVATGGLNVLKVGTQASKNTGIGSSSDFPAPYNVSYSGQRMQMLILGSELDTAGFSIGSELFSLQFPVDSLGSGWGSLITACDSLQISIGSYAYDTLGGFQPGLTKVLGPYNFTPKVGDTANIHIFPTPYQWTGGNIIIETTFSNFSNDTIGDPAYAVFQYHSSTTFYSTVVVAADGIPAKYMAETKEGNPTGNPLLKRYFARPDFRLNGRNITSGNFTWSPDSTLFLDPSATNPYPPGGLYDTVYAHPSVTTTYTATATSQAGCTSSDSVKITVNTSPDALITPDGPTTFCDGESVTLSASDGASYLWSTGEITQTITVTTGGTYTVTITDANGCKGSASIIITVNPRPSTGLIYHD